MDVAAISSVASLGVILVSLAVAIAKWHANQEVQSKQVLLNQKATEKSEAVLVAEIREVKAIQQRESEKQQAQNEKMDERMRNVEQTLAAVQSEVKRNGNGGRTG